MSSTFWFLVGLLTGVTAAAVALPLWRASRQLGAKPGVRLAGTGAGVIAFAAVAVGLYLWLGAPREIGKAPAPVPHANVTRPASGSPAPSMETATAQLANRLEKQGGTDSDWQLLAQSYDFLGRAEDARRARVHVKGATSPTAMPPPTAVSSPLDGGPSAAGADQSLLAAADAHRTKREFEAARSAYVKAIAAKVMTAQSWADYADVVGTLAGGTLNDQAAEAIDNSLALDGSNLKALWLEATLALQQKRYPDALALWQKLRGLLPEASSDAQLVESNIAEAAQLAGMKSPAVANTATPRTQPAALPRSEGADAGQPALSGTVSVDRSLLSAIERGATLFIYAKAVDSPGPPLAVMRTTTDTWPVSFRLDDSMAMIPSRRLSQFQKVVVEARVSRTGQATPATGDLYATSEVINPGTAKKLSLIINRRIG